MDVRVEDEAIGQLNQLESGQTVHFCPGHVTIGHLPRNDLGGTDLHSARQLPHPSQELGFQADRPLSLAPQDANVALTCEKDGILSAMRG